MSTLRTVAFFWLCLLSAEAPAQQNKPQPRMVTLQANDMPLTMVLAQIKTQTGIAVESQLGEPDPKVSLTLKAEPFWKAIDLVAARVEARVTILPRDGRIVLMRSGVGRRPPIISYYGPFRFCVKRLTASWDLETDTRTYLAAVEVAWEPGLQPLFLETFPQQVEALDDKGGRHTVPDGGKSMAPADGRISLMIDVPLPALPRTVTSLTRLEGHLEAIAPSKMLSFTYPKLEVGGVLTQDGVTLKIPKVAIGKDRWMVQVSIENPPGGTILESYQPWDSNNVITLVSQDGKTRLVANSYIRESQSNRRAVLSYHFTNRAKLAGTKPEDWKLVYQTPALVVTMPMMFSFKDVPLP